MALSSDGRLLAIASTFGRENGRVVYVVDSTSGAIIAKLPVPVNRAGFEGLWSATFSADDKVLMCGGCGMAYIWEVASGRLVHSLPNDSWVTHVAFTADNRFAVVSGGGPLNIWDIIEKTLHRKLPTGKTGVCSFALSATTSWALVGGYHGFLGKYEIGIPNILSTHDTFGGAMVKMADISPCERLGLIVRYHSGSTHDVLLVRLDDMSVTTLKSILSDGAERKEIYDARFVGRGDIVIRWGIYSKGGTQCCLVTAARLERHIQSCRWQKTTLMTIHPYDDQESNQLYEIVSAKGSAKQNVD